LSSLFVLAVVLAVVSARVSESLKASTDDTFCYTAAFSTAPNQLKRLPGTGKTLDNFKMYAKGSATITWHSSTNTYDLKMDGLNYPAGIYCTGDNYATGKPGIHCGRRAARAVEGAPRSLRRRRGGRRRRPPTGPRGPG